MKVVTLFRNDYKRSLGMKNVNFQRITKNGKCHCLFLYFLISIISLLLTKSLNAQLSNFNVNNVSIPSPNATSLGKYGNFPVSEFSGTPGIDIPLYTVKLKEFELPISISYNSNGVKVEEDGGQIGIGWSLNAGGVITRAVRSVPDDYKFTWAANGQNIQSPSSPYNSLYNEGAEQSGQQIGEGVGYLWTAKDLAENTIWSALGPTYVKGNNGNFNCLSNTTGTISNVTYGSIDHIWLDMQCYNISGNTNSVPPSALDLEPDVFYFNFNGWSGSFVIGSNKTVYIVPFKPEVKITPAFNAIGEIISFTVVDDKGVVYLFDQVERTRLAIGDHYDDHPDQPGHTKKVFPYNSSWYLSKVTLPNSDAINFTYNNTIIKQKLRTNVYVNKVAEGEAVGRNYALEAMTNIDKFDLCDVKGKILSKIDTKNEEITFLTDARADVAGDQKINAIVVKNKLDAIIKNVAFSYSYISPQNETIPSQTSLQLYYKRLFLNKIEMASGEIFSFAYNSPELLPNKKSFQQDAWGYFNGNSAATMIPKLYVYPNQPLPQRIQYEQILGAVPGLIILDGANRATNSNLVVYGMIKTVTYPTGGTTSFNYESNEYYDVLIQKNVKGGGVRIKSILSYDGLSHTNDQSKEYSYKDFLDPLKSSGRISVKPILASPEIIRAFSTAPTGSVYQYEKDIQSNATLQKVYNNNVTRYSVSMAQLGATTGNYVGYKNVTVTENNLNRIESTYSFPLEYGKLEDEFVVQIKAPLAQPILNIPAIIVQNGFINNTPLPYSNPYPPEDLSNGQFRGKLLNKTYYENSTNKVVYQESYVYENYSNTASQIQYLKGLKVDGGSFPDYADGKAFSTGVYYTRPNVLIRLGEKKTTTYDQKDNKLETTEQYTYLAPASILTPPLHPYVMSQINKGSKEEPVKTDFKYPHNFPSLPVYQGMIQKNIISPIIEKKETVSGIQTKLVRNNFADFSGKYFPKSMEIQNGSGSLETIRVINFYDPLGNPIEVQKNSDIKYSYVWDYQKSYPIAQVSGASSGNIAYTSFEADGKGNWVYNDVGRPQVSGAVTGRKHLSLNTRDGRTVSKENLETGKQYVVSYWSKSSTAYAITGGTSTYKQGLTVNGWTLHEHTVTTTATTITVTGDGMIDELRLYPSESQMTTYAYSPLVGMTSQCDVNNRIVYYEYDEFQRLVLIRDQDNNILKKVCYNYAGQPESCLTVGNVAKSGTFTRACTTCQIGSSVTYTVPANTYTASTQPAADNLAQNDVNTNGQAYANANGTCTNPVSGTLKGTNQIGVKNFTISLVNNNPQCSNTPINFTLNGGSSNVSLGNLFSGNYKVTVTPVGGSVSFTCTINGAAIDGSSSVVFPSQSISNGTLITITPIL